MSFDCIIILANEMDSQGNLNRESNARLRLGSSLFKDAESNKIICCGWDYRPDSDLEIGVAMKNEAIRLGIPGENIIVECNSRDTVGDALFTKRLIVEPNSWKRLLVVTSDYHVDRTAIIFQFIYGKGYHLEFRGAGDFGSAEKVEAEDNSLRAFHKTFEGIDAGNTERIANALMEKHPFYNGRIYSKVKII